MGGRAPDAGGRLCCALCAVRVQSERACPQLDHPGVVRCYGSCLKDGFFCFVMEYAAGGDLDQWLARADASLPLRWIAALEVTARAALQPGRADHCLPQVMNVVEYLHGQGVVHRDIKLENVLRTSSGRAVVADLGLAQTDALQIAADSDEACACLAPLRAEDAPLTRAMQDQKEATLLSRFVGDLRCAAPEAVSALNSGDAARVQSCCNEKTDVFSCGLLLWRLHTKRPVDIRRSSVEELLQAVVEPPALARLLRRMFATDPAERPPASDIVRAVETLCDDDALLGPLGPAVQVRLPSQPQPTRPPAAPAQAMLASEALVSGRRADLDTYEPLHAVDFDVHETWESFWKPLERSWLGEDLNKVRHCHSTRAICTFALTSRWSAAQTLDKTPFPEAATKTTQAPQAVLPPFLHELVTRFLQSNERVAVLLADGGTGKTLSSFKASAVAAATTSASSDARRCLRTPAGRRAARRLPCGPDAQARGHGPCAHRTRCPSAASHPPPAGAPHCLDGGAARREHACTVPLSRA